MGLISGFIGGLSIWKSYGTYKWAYERHTYLEELLDLVRQTGSVPVIRLARGSVLLLEQPSKSSCFAASQQEKKKWSIANTMNSKEKLLVDMVKEEDRKNKRQLGREHRRKQQIAGGFTQRQSRKKRKAKEPNPLSCKKKKQRH